MKVTICEITIGSLVINFVNDVSVETSWEMLTDTATIIIPSKLKIDKDKIENSLKKGDAVEIKLGYGNNLQTVFKGYLTRIKPSTPVELSCEDEMWKFKQINVNESFRGGNLADFLQPIFSPTPIDAFDLIMAPFHASNVNGAQILDKIKSDYSLYSFFRNGKLVIGKQYDPNNYLRHIFQLDYNIESDSLEFMTKDDVKIAVKAISNNEDGTKTEIELGEEGGDTRTLNFYNLPKSELQKIAKQEMDRLIYDGWRGSFTAFGEPFVQHGDIVELRHAEDSDKTGAYWVDRVNYSFGLDGYRQDITLGART